MGEKTAEMRAECGINEMAGESDSEHKPKGREGGSYVKI